MTEGFFAIIIAIVTYLIYDNVARQKMAHTPLDQTKPSKAKTKNQSKAEATKSESSQTATKSRRTAASSKGTKPARKKKTDT